MNGDTLRIREVFATGFDNPLRGTMDSPLNHGFPLHDLQRYGIKYVCLSPVEDSITTVRVPDIMALSGFRDVEILSRRVMKISYLSEYDATGRDIMRVIKQRDRRRNECPLCEAINHLDADDKILEQELDAINARFTGSNALTTFMARFSAMTNFWRTCYRRAFPDGQIFDATIGWHIIRHCRFTPLTQFPVLDSIPMRQFWELLMQLAEEFNCNLQFSVVTPFAMPSSRYRMIHDTDDQVSYESLPADHPMALGLRELQWVVTQCGGDASNPNNSGMHFMHDRIADFIVTNSGSDYNYMVSPLEWIILYGINLPSDDRKEVTDNLKYISDGYRNFFVPEKNAPQETQTAHLEPAWYRGLFAHFSNPIERTTLETPRLVQELSDYSVHNYLYYVPAHVVQNNDTQSMVNPTINYVNIGDDSMVNGDY